MEYEQPSTSNNDREEESPEASQCSSDDDEDEDADTGGGIGDDDYRSGTGTTSSSKKKSKKLSSTTLTFLAVASRTGVTVSLYPLEMVKILMQLGYEPKHPVRSTTIFGRPTMILLNAFSYVKYVKEVDGFTGCFRGITPYFLHQMSTNFITAIVSSKISKLFSRFREPKKKDVGNTTGSGDSPDRDGLTVFYSYLRGAIRDLVSKTVALVVCYPLRTMTCLAVSEFVGRDGIIMKNGLLAGIFHVYKTNGLSGFYPGFLPKLLGDSMQICTLSLVAFILKMKVTHDEPKACLAMSASVLVAAVVYPFNVVSTSMSVCNSGWKLGDSPHVGIYKDWKECWEHLATLSALKRGSSLIYRYYSGPTTPDGNPLCVPGIVFGPDYTAIPLRPELVKL